MHITFVAAVAVLAHATQNLAAPVPVSYDAPHLIARGDNPKQEKTSQGASNAFKKVANIPLRSGLASGVQTVAKVLQPPPPPPQYGTNRLPAYRPPPAAAPPTPQYNPSQQQQFYPPPPPQQYHPQQQQQQAPPGTIARLAQPGWRQPPGKRDIIPDLEIRDLEIDQLD